MLVFVESKEQLELEKGTSRIDELAHEERIRIRDGFSENELTFTGSIPGEYLKATLEVEGASRRRRSHRARQAVPRRRGNALGVCWTTSSHEPVLAGSRAQPPSSQTGLGQPR
jgi:hypothetical protein